MDQLYPVQFQRAAEVFRLFYGEAVKEIRNRFLEKGFEPVLPRYMPFYLSKHRFETESIPGSVDSYSVIFEGGGKSLTINILQYMDEARADVYKSSYAELIEQLQVLNTDAYILKQEGLYCAVFRLGPVIYNISSNVGHDEFLKIINSCQEN